MSNSKRRETTPALCSDCFLDYLDIVETAKRENKTSNREFSSGAKTFLVVMAFLWGLVLAWALL